jgi:hypothetical protein
MIGNVDDLSKIWGTLGICYQRPEKYMIEDFKPIIKFKKYRMTDSMALGEFYSDLRATIKSARTVSRLKGSVQRKLRWVENGVN